MLRAATIYPYIPVQDIERGLAFYRDRIGLGVEDVNAYTATLVCGNDSKVVMYRTPSAGTNQASQAFWAVDDVDAEVRALTGLGIVFERYEGAEPSGVMEAGGTRAAWFKDPDGNILGLIQKL